MAAAVFLLFFNRYTASIGLLCAYDTSQCFAPTGPGFAKGMSARLWGRMTSAKSARTFRTASQFSFSPAHPLPRGGESGIHVNIANRSTN